MNNLSFYKQIDLSMMPHYLDKFRESTTANVYWKDKKGIYLNANDVYLCTNNLKPNDIIGVPDFDYSFGKEHALLLREHDQYVMYKGQSKTALESVKVKGIIYYYLSHKAPLRTKSRKIIGIVGVSFPMNQENEIFTALNEMNIIANISEIHKYKSLFSSSNLTQRQLDCIYYLVKGKTMKETAKILGLAPKTIEHYLGAVKAKLNCYTRSELIEKSLKLPEIKEKLGIV